MVFHCTSLKLTICLDMQNMPLMPLDHPKPRPIIKAREDGWGKRIIKMPLRDHGAEAVVRSRTPYIHRAGNEQAKETAAEVRAGDIGVKRTGQDAEGKNIVDLFYFH